MSVCAIMGKMFSQYKCFIIVPICLFGEPICQRKSNEWKWMLVSCLMIRKLVFQVNRRCFITVLRNPIVITSALQYVTLICYGEGSG